MSCQMMDGGIGGLLIGTIVVGGILYSCGPNIIVGAAGTSIYGVKSCVDKVRLIAIEKFETRATNEEAVAYIRWKIKCAKRELANDLNHTYAFAISMIPIIGGYLGLKAWITPTSTTEEEAENQYWNTFEKLAAK